MNVFLNTHRQEFKEFVESICSVSPERGPEDAPPASYGAPSALRNRLPPTSAECLASLPYLLDQSRELAALVATWIEAVPPPSSPHSSSASAEQDHNDTSEANEAIGPAVAFDRICRSLRAQTRTVLLQADQAGEVSGCDGFDWKAMLRQIDLAVAHPPPKTASAEESSDRDPAARIPVLRRGTGDLPARSGNASAISVGASPTFHPPMTSLPPSSASSSVGMVPARRLVQLASPSDRTGASTPQGSSTTGTTATMSTTGAARPRGPKSAATYGNSDSDDSDASPGHVSPRLPKEGQASPGYASPGLSRRRAVSPDSDSSDDNDDNDDNDENGHPGKPLFPTHALSWDDPTESARRRPSATPGGDAYDLHDSVDSDSDANETLGPLGLGRGRVAFGESAASLVHIGAGTSAGTFRDAFGGAGVPFGSARLHLPMPPPAPFATNATPASGARRGSAPAISTLPADRRRGSQPDTQRAPHYLRKECKVKPPASPKEPTVGKRFADVWSFRRKGTATAADSTASSSATATPVKSAGGGKGGSESPEEQRSSTKKKGRRKGE